MTSLLLVLLANLAVTVQEPVMLTPPTKVRFDSVDYKNILCWTSPNNSTAMQYHVQWKIYGERQWFDADGCQGIQRFQCDLSGATSDPREWYYARVHASSPPASKSAWALSPRFSPCWDTEISPPVLRLTVTEREILVRVKPPKRSVRKIHSNLLYKIYLTNTSGEEEVFEMDCCFDKLTIRGLHHKARYCLQAQILMPLQAKLSARGSIQCVTTA